MDVVVVESPAKARTINKYLGRDFVVLASYGHVRDLPSKTGAVRPEEDFAMDYESIAKSTQHLKVIAESVKKAENLYLATDPDREGEAISWHLLEVLQIDFGITDISAKRVVFNEITQKAVIEGIQNPRDLDEHLINAQQARRALDYLVGFTLSPILWRKLPGARSAGRVQSVALRLTCEREVQIEAFQPREYWTIDVHFKTPKGDNLTSRLVKFDSTKLDRFSLSDQETCDRVIAEVSQNNFEVTTVETKPTLRNPQPPFTTSSMQQEASRKLRFSAKKTMDVAQALYHGIELDGDPIGLITYMRTDGVQMAEEAVTQARNFIESEFGTGFRPGSPRIYKTKAKNAQEAHEAIRPTDFNRHPNTVRKHLNSDQAKLYELIWMRALASQMESARLLRTSIEIFSANKTIGFRTTGTVIDFPGFLKLYEEGQDDQEKIESDDTEIAKVNVGDKLAKKTINPSQHFTEPPPRYTEATLVKKLEELGIGRPSTYATILSVLQERNYVTLEKGRFIPQDKGRLVTAFLESYFSRYVEYDFTADLETRLDQISDGSVDWKTVLQEFWKNFKVAVEDTTELRVRDVFSKLNDLLAPHLYPQNGTDRNCPACKIGQLSLKGGRNGFFLGCASYPDCRYTRSLSSADDGDDALADGPRHLCDDPDTGSAITLRKGPYGLYFQIGEMGENNEKPKRVALPKDVPIASITPDLAIQLLTLPRELGLHPETQKPIYAGIGRYGPYLQTDGRYYGLETTADTLTIGINLAVSKIADAPEKSRRVGPKVLRKMDNHPDGGEIVIFNGRYGPYIKYKSVNATLPKDRSPETITFEEAIEILRLKVEKKGGAKKRPKKNSVKS